MSSRHGQDRHSKQPSASRSRQQTQKSTAPNRAQGRRTDTSGSRSSTTKPGANIGQQNRWLSATWNQWRLQTYRQPLDKFIRQKASEFRRQYDIPLPLHLSQKLFDAARFTPLICALEMGFQRQRPLSEKDWYNCYHTDAALDINDNAFWFWLALRQGHDADRFWSLDKGWQAGNRQQYWQEISELVTADAVLNDLSQLLADSHKLPQYEDLQPWFWLWNGFPATAIPDLQQRAQASQWSAADVQKFVKLQAQRPPTYLRLKSDQDTASCVDSLKQQGVRVVRTQTADFDYQQALAIDGGQSIQQTDWYRDGQVEIQDLASQIATSLIPISARQHIWDACAGAGGKTLAMAQRLGNRGSVTATDCYANKLQELKKRAKRAELMNIRSFPWDGEQPLKLPKAIAQRQGFDCVVTDVPCSGSGTWRRNPDIIWQDQGGSHGLEKIQQLQQALLSNASHAVRPNGYLVYITCSWRVEENEQQIAEFLKHNDQFNLQEQQLIGQPQLNSDCLFIARLQRQDKGQ